MLWFGKKKIKADGIESEELSKNESEENLGFDGDIEIVSEEEILDSLNEDEGDAVKASDADGEETDEAEADADSEEDDAEAADVIEKITSLDKLVEYVNGKAIGSIQYMRKETNEAFALREVYLRIARVWGSVSMAREYTPAEYAKIMLATEIIEDPDAFYVLPMLTDAEREKAIIDFCDERYGSGKKYARNTEKFAKVVNENGDKEDWLAYTKWLLTDKVTEFCDKNGITFDTETENETEGEADE